MAGDTDPFLRQLAWLVDRAGGKEGLARACGRQVGLRTLDTWSRGGYPRTTVSAAVRSLDAWALAHAPGYPDAASAPRLVDSCGPGTPTPSPAPSPTPVPPRHRPRAWRWLALGAGQLAVVAATVAVTLAVNDLGASADGTRPAVEVLPGLLPSEGDGRSHPQVVGPGALTTYSDPRGLTAGSGAIPAGTAVDVRCRIAAAPMPSAGLEGWWYLVDSVSWAGQWAAADGFEPGARPGRDDGHDVDLDVPECSTSVTWRPGG